MALFQGRKLAVFIIFVSGTINTRNLRGERMGERGRGGPWERVMSEGEGKERGGVGRERRVGRGRRLESGA